MKKALRNLAIAGLASLTLAGCNNETKEVEVSKPKIVEVVSNLKTGQAFTIEYYVVGDKLQNSYNEFILPDNFGCVTRYSGVMPGGVRTCPSMREGDIVVSFLAYSDMVRSTTIEIYSNSEDINGYRARFEKDKKLLREAGLIQ